MQCLKDDRIDQVTVQALQLRAPRYSKRDALVLEGQLVSGQIQDRYGC